MRTWTDAELKLVIGLLIDDSIENGILQNRGFSSKTAYLEYLQTPLNIGEPTLRRYHNEAIKLKSKLKKHGLTIKDIGDLIDSKGADFVADKTINKVTKKKPDSEVSKSKTEEVDPSDVTQFM